MPFGVLVSLSFGVVVREKTLALVLIPLVLSLLTACSAEAPGNSNKPLIPSADDVAKRCLAYAAGSGGPPLTVGEMNALQWRRYVSCALTSNVFVDANSDLGNPDAIVSLRLNSDGSIGSVTLLHTSGNDAWDAAVQRAIVAASPLPPASPNQNVSRVDFHLRPRHRPLGIGGSTGLTGASHWSVEHCITVGRAGTCE
ncbi:energy transducer TonB [Paraburkholderia sediminicola]|uniref:energy transducer TonB n=1 Tax=Paraburkholderia sediminicola TaxID=458836 RepID=UPI0038BA914E